MKIKSQKSQTGFTLAELLISLMILGEIATFTIPKILNSQQNGQRNAVMKETIATLSSVYYTGYLMGDLPASNTFTYISTKINAVKICPTNGVTEGCTTSSKEDGSETLPTLVLHNGAQLTYHAGAVDDFHVDWNGDAGPNLYGTDLIMVIASPSGWTWCGTTIKKGVIDKLPAGCGTWSFENRSNALYATIFQ